ncbi:Rid family hydrolase [Tamilnaduibacter salinus]|uniref:Rid family hydrolase n=1 Tax=Tamilnaduibacter salinus TaxID=1484056 RepID=UPI002AE03C1A|nr:Rid family hydrolase [Tamilnaduibacter salinus]
MLLGAVNAHYPGCWRKTPDIIRTRIMLTDISNWEQAAKAHGELFSEIRPACTFVEVSRFIDPEWLVETEVDFVLDQK